MVVPGGRKYVLRDDGYRVYAREEGTSEDMEECLFEYKHSGQINAHHIVQELLTRASVVRGRDEINAATIPVSWASDGTGFRE